MEVIIITGLSGAGKSAAMDCLEDQGYYCVDNMPLALIKSFINLSRASGGSVEKAAFVIDIRGATFSMDLSSVLEELHELGVNTKIIFLEASNSVLIRRFNETRRLHPATGNSPTSQDFNSERQLMSDILKRADWVIDTSNMKTANLKTEIVSILNQKDKKEGNFLINIMSFGFKRGLPLESDLVFDVRFIPNPYYVESLKKATGINKKVKEYVLRQEVSKVFIKEFWNLIKKVIPSYRKEGKFHLNIAFGCTGGQHRSVVIAREFEKMFKQEGYFVTLEHRDIKK